MLQYDAISFLSNIEYLSYYKGCYEAIIGFIRFVLKLSSTKWLQNIFNDYLQLVHKLPLFKFLTENQARYIYCNFQHLSNL